MELRVLEYFLAVAREQNFTRAAEFLHLTQPTLSRQLADLESELGKVLLVRGKRKVTLTNDGVFLRRRAEEILSLARRTVSEMKSSEEEVSGDICGGFMMSTRASASTSRAARPRISPTASTAASLTSASSSAMWISRSTTICLFRTPTAGGSWCRMTIHSQCVTRLR